MGELAFIIIVRLPLSLLAAYDLGAPAKLLQAIFDAEKSDLDPIHLADRKEKKVEEQRVDMNKTNWWQ